MVGEQIIGFALSPLIYSVADISQGGDIIITMQPMMKENMMMIMMMSELPKRRMMRRHLTKSS